MSNPQGFGSVSVIPIFSRRRNKIVDQREHKIVARNNVTLEERKCKTLERNREKRHGRDTGVVRWPIFPATMRPFSLSSTPRGYTRLFTNAIIRGEKVKPKERERGRL